MKPILPVLVLASLLATGCSATNISKLVTAIGKDPASVSLRVTSVYGTVTYTRTNPMTNSLAHSLAPDGTIIVTRDGMVGLDGAGSTNRTEQLRHLDNILNPPSPPVPQR